MSRLSCLVALLLSAVAPFLRADPLPVSAVQPISAREAAHGFRDGSVLAKPKKGSDESALRSHESAKGVRLRRHFARLDSIRLLEFAESQEVGKTVESLRASGLYEYVEPNYVRHALAVPNDPRFAEQWALSNLGQNGGTSGADIHATKAWNLRTDAGNVTVAVLDSGVRATHEDLAANLWLNPKETAANGVDDDHNGYVDDVHGFNSLVPVGDAKSGDINDTVGHGTAVASVIAASGNNGKGISGVAWTAKLMICRMVDRGGYSSSADIIESVDYAVANGAKIINISSGGPSYSTAEYEAMKKARDAGVIIVASAGNEAQSDQYNASFPASLPLENVVSVANTTSQDTLASSSTYGGLVELGAPGTDILACSKDTDTSYEAVSGTSFSAPMVSGSLALLAAQFPGDSYRQLINRLLRSVDKIPALAGKVQTGGRLNLEKALSSSPGENRPFNDDFASRAQIDGDSFNSRGVSVGATVEPGEPTHGAAGGASLWWTWTAANSGTVVIDTETSTFDTTLAVYTGSTLSTLQPVASNDDAPGRQTSRVSFTAVAGLTYQIAVDGKNGATGLICLALSFKPANDDFAHAATLSGLGRVPGDNRAATRETGEPTASSGSYKGQGKTVWYSWTAPKSGTFSFVAYTNVFTPLVSVYTGSTVGGLTLVGSSTDDCTISAIASTTYHIGIDSTDTRAGNFLLNYNECRTQYIGLKTYSSPVLAPDGSLIIVSESGTVWRLNSSGVEKDKLIGSSGVNTPSFAADGTLYVTTSTSLYAIGSDKTHKWTKDYDKGVGSSPAIGRGGMVVIHTNDGFLRAIAPSGDELWSTAVPGNSLSSPSIAADGTIYIGSTDHNLYAVSSSTGAIKWKYDLGGTIHASPAIGDDGTVYIGSLASSLYAVTSSGALSWTFPVSDGISSSAAIASDGTVYFGSHNKNLYALSSRGTLKWSYATKGEIRLSSPAISANGTVYVGSYDGILYGISPTGVLTQELVTSGVIPSSPLLLSTEVVIASADGRLYRAPVGSAGTASSAWPMHRQNPARTGKGSLDTAPAVVTQPASTVVALGGSAALSVKADGQAPFSYQWYLNGVAIAGANQSTYTINNASDASAGSYTVVVTNAFGSATSGAAHVSVAAASDVGRIVNLSARAVAGADASTLIVGMVIGPGDGTKPLLIRGVGPTLAQAPYNVSGVLSDPLLRLFPANASVFTASNDDWGSDSTVAPALVRAGAFPFLSPKDAALTTELSSGGYTVHVTSAAGTNASGVALAEFYDITPVFTATTPRLMNISARSHVGQGADVLILGFVIGGSTPVKVLIRAVGPTLGQTPFDLSGALADPKLTLRKQATGEIVQENDDWGTATNATELQATMASAGAFSLSMNSKDAAIIATLPPGAYTATISGVNSAGGIALGEVYVVH